ncbi:MAG: hypothetical protein PHF51_05105 [Candidatus ainarchaeum sp.]|nr:hypothetical protein [Candidatus ainarchaeum sp.]
MGAVGVKRTDGEPAAPRLCEIKTISALNNKTYRILSFDAPFGGILLTDLELNPGSLAAFRPDASAAEFEFEATRIPRATVRASFFDQRHEVSLTLHETGRKTSLERTAASIRYSKSDGSVSEASLAGGRGEHPGAPETLRQKLSARARKLSLALQGAGKTPPAAARDPEIARLDKEYEWASECFQEVRQITQSREFIAWMESLHQSTPELARQFASRDELVKSLFVHAEFRPGTASREAVLMAIDEAEAASKAFGRLLSGNPLKRGEKRFVGDTVLPFVERNTYLPESRLHKPALEKARYYQTAGHTGRWVAHYDPAGSVLLLAENRDAFLLVRFFSILESGHIKTGERFESSACAPPATDAQHRLLAAFDGLVNATIFRDYAKLTGRFERFVLGAQKEPGALDGLLGRATGNPAVYSSYPGAESWKADAFVLLGEEMRARRGRMPGHLP